MPTFHIEHPDGSAYDIDADSHEEALGAFNKIPGIPAVMQQGVQAPITGKEAVSDLGNYGIEAAKGVPILGGLGEGMNYLPKQKEFEEQHPYGSMLAQFVGGGVGYSGAAKAFPKVVPKLLGAVGETWPSRLAFGVPVSAGIGATEASTRGEDPFYGAIIGGAGGLVAPGVSEGVSRLAGVGLDALATQRAAAKGLPAELRDLTPTAARKLKEGTRGFSEPDWQNRASYLGPHGSLYEYTPESSRLAENVAQHDPAFRQSIEQRAAGAPERIAGHLDNFFGPENNMRDTIASLKFVRQVGANPAYEEWHRTSVPMTPELTNILKKPSVQSVSAKAQKFAGDEGRSIVGPNGEPTAGTWDYMKQALDDAALAAPQGSKERRNYWNISHQITDAIDNHPDPNVAGKWQDGRRKWAEPSKVLDALEYGQNVFKKGQDPDEFAERWARMSDPEKEGVRQGSRKFFGLAMGDSSTEGRAQRDLLRTDNAQKKLQIMDPGKSDQLINGMERERTFKGEDKNTAYGSPTARRTIEEKEQEGIGKTRGEAFTEGASEFLENPMGTLGYSKPVLAAERAQAEKNAYPQLTPILTAKDKKAQELGQALATYSQPGPSEKWQPLIGKWLSMMMAGPGIETIRNKVQRK